ncbi:MAG: FAD-dependent oxidoreductase [Deltaproteobacteria bacterium]|nr:FAD-dependent oxidoreductase [Deltaproteobacteria bacterium]
MERLFEAIRLDHVDSLNRFVFPPIKTGYGGARGEVTGRQLLFYAQIARNGPGIVILEPVSVTPAGREHPRQLCVHQPDSMEELSKIAAIIHQEGRLACLHLNHAGAAANPKATGMRPRAPSIMTCPASGQEAEPLDLDEIERIVASYASAAAKAQEAGFDMIEVQAGHGYLVSQFLNRKTNRRDDSWGEDRLRFAREVLAAVRRGAPGIPRILRISGDEMSPEFGIDREDLASLLKLAERKETAALHVGMGNACFSPPWYFHHASLPDGPQLEALSWLRERTSLPLIVAGRMGRREKVIEILDRGLADFVALGRPLIADPGLIEKWRTGKDDQVLYCGYCLQGCLHRVKSGDGLGCNLNPQIGLPALGPTDRPRKVLIAGGGPAGMSAALYLTRRGHHVTLAEKEDHLGGQFSLAWKAPGKEAMKEGLLALARAVERSGTSIVLNRAVDAALVREVLPELLIWATGAEQNVPDIQGLGDQRVMTSLEYFRGEKEVLGPRVLVIGAGRAGLEIAEKLGGEGFEVTATKRTDPLGSGMEMITQKLTLKRLGEQPRVTLMPHTAVKEFFPDTVDIEQDGVRMSLEPFQTIILASGMNSAPGPDEEIRRLVPDIQPIGDMRDVQDIFAATRAGYEIALRY